MDTIDARIVSLKKEVANLKASRKRLLSSATGPSCLGDRTLILGLWLDYYPLCSFISFPNVYFSPLSLYLVHFYFLALIYFGFVIYYAISATSMFYDIVYFTNISWSSLLFVFALNQELQMKTHYNAFLWHYPLQEWLLGGKKKHEWKE